MLFRFGAALLSIALASQRRFGAALLTRLEVVRVSLDFLDDVLLLDFPLKAAQCALERFTILDINFSQFASPPHGQV